MGKSISQFCRSQLEQYIAEELGADRLSSGKNQTELRKIKKEMADLQKRLNELQTRRTEIEKVHEEIASRTKGFCGRGTAAESRCSGSRKDHVNRPVVPAKVAWNDRN